MTGFDRRKMLGGTAAAFVAGATTTANAADQKQGSGAIAASDDPNRSISGASTLPQLPKQAGDPPLAPPDEQPPKLDVPQPVDKQLGWAVVGLGTLALGEIMPAFGVCRRSRPRALVSGHRSKAKQVAKVYDISQDSIYDYKNYDGIAKDSSIDVVYIVLPNSMHAEYTIRALEAGKDVFCEKPMAVTVGEAQRMIDAAKANNRKLGIAYRLHHEPMNMAAAEICRSGQFGAIRTIATSFGINVGAPNIRLAAELGGGPLGDIGVYCLNAMRYLTGQEPDEVFGQSYRPKDDPRFREVPAEVCFQARFPSGVIGHASASFNSSGGSQFRVLCDQGIVEMEPAYAYRGLRLRTMLDKSENLPGDPPVDRNHRYTEVNQFAQEMDAFSSAVIDQREFATEGEAGLKDMKIMAAINQSIRENRPVSLNV